MKDPDDRFGMPDSAFIAALDAHGRDNPTIRSGMYVPTRQEVAQKSPEWLHSVLIDWMWESPSELIPNNAQISQVRSILAARIDANSPLVRQLLDECDEFTKT